MPAGELVQVVIFCQSYRLLEISALEPRSSIVVWREVHIHCIHIIQHNSITYLYIQVLDEAL